MDPKFKPQKVFFNHLKNEYSRSHYGYSGYKIESYVLEQLLCAAYGVTAWLFSKDGANWIFRVVGVEEIQTHHAFKYYYQNGSESQRRLIDVSRIKIFRRTVKEHADITKSSLEVAKRVVYTEGWKIPEDKLFVFCLTTYRSWIKTSNGLSWLRDYFSPIKYIEVFGDIAYRCGSYTGEVFWLSEDQVKTEPGDLKSCQCCDMSHPCVDDYTGLGPLCNRCYAENFAESEVLELCNRHECKEYCCSFYLTHAQLMGASDEVEDFPIQWRKHG